MNKLVISLANNFSSDILIFITPLWVKGQSGICDDIIQGRLFALASIKALGHTSVNEPDINIEEVLNKSYTFSFNGRKLTIFDNFVLFINRFN